MRLDSRHLLPADREGLCLFSKWLLRVDNGIGPTIQIASDRSKRYIKIPESLLLPQHHRQLDGLISFVYSHGCEPEHPSS
jgi:hypothetical protein